MNSQTQLKFIQLSNICSSMAQIKTQLTKQQIEVQLINIPYRKRIIEEALKRLKVKNKNFLAAYENSRNWSKFQEKFAVFGLPSSINKIVDLKLCEAADPETTYFNPFTKPQILFCYNKIDDEKFFNRQLTYNLVLLYDTKANSNQNWNEINDTVRSNIRALNISEICNQKNKECFKKQLQRRVEKKDRFQGIAYNFDKIYEECINDYSPLLS